MATHHSLPNEFVSMEHLGHGLGDLKRHNHGNVSGKTEEPPKSVMRVANTEFVSGCDPKICVLCAGVRHQAEDKKFKAQKLVWIILFVLELIFGIVCMILEAVFEVTTIFTRHYGYHYNKDNMRHFLCSVRLLYATVYGLPIMVLLLLITILVRKFTFRLSIFPLMFLFIGFVLYLCTGIVTLAFTKHGEKWISIEGKKSFASFAIFTSLIYLAHFIYCIWKKP